MTEIYKNQGEQLWKSFSATKEKSLWFYHEILNILKEKLQSPLVKRLEEALHSFQLLIQKSA
jgi:hypothetical protein